MSKIEMNACCLFHVINKNPPPRTMAASHWPVCRLRAISEDESQTLDMEIIILALARLMFISQVKSNHDLILKWFINQKSHPVVK